MNIFTNHSKNVDQIILIEFDSEFWSKNVTNFTKQIYQITLVFLFMLTSSLVQANENHYINNGINNDTSFYQDPLGCTIGTESLSDSDPSCGGTYDAFDALVKFDRSFSSEEYIYIKSTGFACCGEVLVNPKSGTACYDRLIAGPSGLGHAVVEGGSIDSSCDFSSLETCSSQYPTTATVNCVHGEIVHRITFLGSIEGDVAGETYWYYKVENGISDCRTVKGISHLTFAFANQDECCVPNATCNLMNESQDCKDADELADFANIFPPETDIQNVFKDVETCGETATMTYEDSNYDVTIDLNVAVTYSVTRTYTLNINGEIFTCQQFLSVKNNVPTINNGNDLVPGDFPNVDFDGCKPVGNIDASFSSNLVTDCFGNAVSTNNLLIEVVSVTGDDCNWTLTVRTTVTLGNGDTIVIREESIDGGDKIAPVITFDGDISDSPFDLGCNPEMPNPTFTVMDNCAEGLEAMVDFEDTINGCATTRIYTVTASDGCNNATPISITYTWIVDTDKPVIATTATSGDLGCNPTVVAPEFTLTEACSPGDIMIVDSGVVADAEGCGVSQTWTANFTDDCGNAADEVSITYTWIVDTDKPVIATTAMSGDLGCNPTVVAPEFTLTEACSPGDIMIVDSGVVADAEGCGFSQTWTANFTDDCGNAADEVVIKYTWIVDTDKPVIATTAMSGDLGCNPMSIPTPEFTLTEACSPGDIMIVDSGVVADAEGCGVSQTWTANFTDDCGNAADEVVIKYTWIVDTDKPVIATTAMSGDLGCNPMSIPTPEFTLTEACSPGDIMIVDSGVVADAEGCGVSQTWTANFTDDCGNAADEVVIKYTWIVDTDKPVIATTATSGDLGCNPTVVAPEFTLTEACSPGDIMIVDSGVVADAEGCGVSQTWTANFTDDCGNAADEVSITYTWIVDTDKPVIATTAMSGDLGCNPMSIPTPEFTLTEACSPGDIMIVDSGVVADAEGCGVSQTWTANFTDDCGNAADEVVIKYTWIVDTDKPVIATTAMSGDLGCNPTVVAPEFTLTEACSPGDIMIVDSGVVADAEGCGVSQTWTANFTDDCGNAADEVVIKYTWIVDTDKPVIATTAMSGDLGCNPMSISTPEFTLTEACSPGDIMIVDSGVVADAEGCGVSQTWTANFTDDCGNAADEVSVTYTWIVDTDKSVIATTAMSGDLGCNPMSIPTPEFTLTEACSPGDIMIVDSGVVADAEGCGVSQTWTANFTDDCGNAADEVVIKYTWIVDTDKPVIATTAMSGDLGCNPTVVAPEFTLTEACSPGDIMIVDSGVVADAEGCGVSQTWTANFTDDCGNVADEVSITYTWIVDTDKPVIATTATSGDLGCNPMSIPIPEFTLTEACSPGDIMIVDSGVVADAEGCGVSQTWTANFTDDCGNAADEVVIKYTWIVDTDKPVIATTAMSGDLGCNPTVVAPEFTLTEACSPGDIMIVDSGVVADAEGCGVSQTWTANFTDDCGNVADEVSITYTWIVDTDKPVIATTAMSGDLGCNPTSIPTPEFTLTEACSPGDIMIVDSGVVADAEGCGVSQTWTANFTDDCGNAADEVVIKYTWIVDTDKPVIATTATSGDLGCNPTVVAPEFTLTEACSPGDIMIVDSGVVADAEGCGVSQTWTANFTDDCGNAADEVSITYTWIVDTDKPVIATTAMSGDLGCNPTVVAPEFTLTEACSPGDIMIVDSGVVADAEGCGFSQTWTANFTDDCGNAADEVVIKYTWIVDTDKPVIATTAMSGDLGCNPMSIPTPEFTLTEACSPGDIMIVDSGVVADAEGCGVSQTWTANFTDDCGNVADEVSITYTWIVDTDKPVIATTATSGDLGCNPTVVAPEFTLTEACSPGDIMIVDSGVVADAEGCGVSQTWTANFTDDCGNAADEVSVTYTWIVDTDKPVIATTAMSGDLGCNPTSIPTPEFTLTEACSPGDIMIVDSGVVADAEGCGFSQTWTANFTDDCGNAADEVVIKYTWIVDTDKPVIATTAMSGDLGCNPTVVAPEFTLTEACSPGDIMIVDSGVVADAEGCGVSQTWTANFTDDCGNAADEVVIKYTWIVDTDKPVIATTATSGDLGCNPTVVAPEFTLTEACSPGDIMIVDSGVVADAEGCGVSQTWTANFTDDCGNAADEVVIKYTWIVDTDKPVIATTATSGDLGCNPTVVAPEFTLTEACSPGDIMIVDSGVVADAEGCGVSQTWTANFTDDCGNAADEVSITYTWIVDTDKPVIATTAMSGDLGCNPTVVAPEFTLTEACSPGDIMIVDSGVVADAEGCGVSQTWTANFTDDCGNAADEVSITYTWTVDTEKPVIATTAMSGDLGCNPTVVAPEFTLTEACSPGDIMIVDSGVVADAEGCGVSQTWTANFTDDCGNAADEVSITYTWTVDTEKPVIATTAMSGDLGCNPTVVAPEFTLTEACSPGDIMIVDSGVVADAEGCGVSQTWTANFTDDCGNAADEVSITYTWTVDTEKPVIATTAMSGDLGCNPMSIPTPEFTLTEACSPGDIMIVDSGVVADAEGCGVSQTWTANFTDDCGNAADEVSITYTWTVDTEAPVIECPIPDEGSDSIFLGCNPESTNGIPNNIITSVDYTDNCIGSGTITSYDDGVGVTFDENLCEYSLTRTFDTVTDNCGNSATCSVTYTWKIPETETAFGFLNDDDDEFTADDESTCFIEDGFNRWGWTTALDFSEETGQSSYEMDIYAGAAQCDLTKGTDVGSVNVEYNGDSLTFTYNLVGFALSEAHIYIGDCNQPYPLKRNGRPTVAPGQYTYVDGGFGYVENYSVTIPVEGTQFNVIVHGVTSESQCSCLTDTSVGNPMMGSYEGNAIEGCDTASNVVASTTARVGDFNVSPVPFKDTVTVNYLFDYETDVTIEIYDLKGALMSRMTDSKYKKGSKGSSNIDMSRLQQSMYIVSLSTNRDVLKRKILSSN